MIINFDADDIFEKKCKRMVEILEESRLPVVVCGDVDESLYVKFFKDNNIIPVNVYDRSPALHGKKCAFGEIINAKDIERLYQDFNAVIVVPYFDEIKQVLMESGSKAHNIFFLDIAKLHSHPTMFLPGAREKISAAINEFNKMYDEFTDDLSKQVWENVVNYWICGDYRLVKKYKGKQTEQYLDFFQLHEKEIFVNCGAFDGRYSKRFSSLVNNKYRKIFNIECDDNNYKVLCTNMGGLPNVENIKIGLHNKKTTLHFNAKGNGMSCVEENGNIDVEVDTLDNILHGEKATFIKMDIEGSEYAALEGASATIKKYAPKMAICIYHNIDDFVKIPRLIKRLNPEYKFGVRHYTDTLTETVLFAWV